jgi:integrase
MGKARKGSVVVGQLRESLFLRWQFEGKRYTLYLGLADSQAHRQVAQGKAHQIELDILSGHFDKTLKAYKPSTNRSTNQTAVTGLFERFMAYKAKTVAESTLGKYSGLLGVLKEYFGDASALSVDVPEAEKFVAWFQGYDLVPRVKRERVELLTACWAWADLPLNPWIGLSLRIKVPPKQMPNPFTREEIGAIIQAFRTDKYYYPYADYVQFLFGTGCRTSEAIGLQWKHLSADYSSVWIGETLVRGKRQSTKTNRARTIALTDGLRVMLIARKPAKPDPEALVFAGPNGLPISDGNFRSRAWKTILKRLEIDYRKPYLTRHTLISHALDLGMAPVLVAQLTGHDVQTLYENYSGSVHSRPKLPDVLQ